ncbi:LOW QUALITY PROTEIN: hypothetical protein PHMEG_00037690 [Phytophthora megakarya]|uniref:Retrotransposon gag domain-containing protein n=1 Tax=Phytophthora megakarya TaxID=4795 RepID=A0A225UJ13_9STRA|nr:LOW QUALITY PROTEIN: hypothetical protein PHMEG_00037690 [Phytophthora megakarya]
MTTAALRAAPRVKNPATEVRVATMIGVKAAPVAAAPTVTKMTDARDVKNADNEDTMIDRHTDYNVKDLDIPTYVPSPDASVSTWIERVDLMLKGAEETGRGNWTDRHLYFIIGSKLQDDAARWWVNLNRGLKESKQRWSYLKKALTRRYGEKLDSAVAEWRVNSRVLMAGESYADFGAGLRSAAGRNKVREKVLVAAFLRNLDRTTRSLLLQGPKPKTLEKAIKQATKYEDPYSNVAPGTATVGPPRATAASTSYMMPMMSTTGQTALIPGVGAIDVPDEIVQQQRLQQPVEVE